jgi:hypothetical protein
MKLTTRRQSFSKPASFQLAFLLTCKGFFKQNKNWALQLYTLER